MTEKEQQSTIPPEQTQSLHNHAEDEINLLDLLEVLIRKKALILAITSICTLLAIFYAQSITPTYRTTIAFLEPQESFLSALPLEIAEELPHSIMWDDKDVVIQNKPSPFIMFLSKVESYKLKHEVFENGGFQKKFFGDTRVDTDQAVLEIHNSIKIIKKKNGAGSASRLNKPVYFEMEGSKPKVMSEFLTALVEPAKQNTIKDFNDQVRLIISTKINSISMEIENLRQTAKAKREKDISTFSEALVIAKNLGIKNNNFSTAVDIRYNGLPIWYLYGEKALQQEIMNLKSKKNGDVIQGLPEKEIELKKYQAIDLSLLKAKVATVSQPSIPSTTPIKPEKIKIIAPGMVLGLFIGIIMAFVRNSIDQLRKRQLSSTST